MEYLISAIGSVLVLAALVLFFQSKSATQGTVALVLGVFCSLSAAGFLPTIKGPGIEATMHKEVTEAKGDISQALAPVNLAITNSKEALFQQERFNKMITARLETLTKSINPAAAKLSEPDINARSEANKGHNAYAVLVFYRETRHDDALKLIGQLTSSGFQSSAIYSGLDETQVGPQPKGSTYVIATQHGLDVTPTVEYLAKTALPSSPVTVGAAYPLRRGDVQIYLF